jgi:ATP-dependent DNA ligase
MKPLLAHIYEPKRIPPGIPVHIQPKLNGVRALYQAGNFQSRDELPWNPKVLKHLTDELKELFPEPEIILDGELYVHDWNLQRINGAVQIARSEPREDTHFVEYHIFDRVSYQLSFRQRLEVIEQRRFLMDRNSKIRMVTTYFDTYPEMVEQAYMDFVQQKFEGIMYRLGDCPYTRPKDTYACHGMKAITSSKFASDKNNRCWHLLKRKDWQDDDFLCVSVEEGIGKRSGMVGRFVCKVHPDKDVTFGVGSGPSDSQLLYYFNHPEEVIGRKIKVKFLTYTTEGKPFNPTIEAIL